MVQPIDVIIINPGSVTEIIVQYLPNDIQLTVICYTINVFTEIHKKKTVKSFLPVDSIMKMR